MTPLPSGKHGVGCGREGVLPPTSRAPRHGVRLPRPGPPTEGCAVWDSEPPLRGDVCFGRASSGPRGNSRPSEGVTEWPAQGGDHLPAPPTSPGRAGGGKEDSGSGSVQAPSQAERGLHLSLGACTCHSCVPGSFVPPPAPASSSGNWRRTPAAQDDEASAQWADRRSLPLSCLDFLQIARDHEVASFWGH